MHGQRFLPLLAVILLIANLKAAEPRRVQLLDGNRLAYLDRLDLYYPHRDFPKLVTPQWVGEEGVEAVVILAIDDMKDSKKYESYLRPILNRLKQIDGRAPVSIMTCSCDPSDPQLQGWLKEGLSLETHTFDHPCPLLQKGDFPKAKATYDKCVDLLASVPNSKPVAFRTPCCDSLNTPSPRFFAHIFNERTEKGHFLSIDTSVFNIFTASDPALPRELVLDADGKEKFRKYIPTERSFVNTIEDYPYPYVIGKVCWEFPCVNPSDWQAQHLHKPNNPITVKDWQAALDCTVSKQGVFCLVFHPHNWIKPEQVVDLIDHAVAKHGTKVKFLTFKEAQERLDKNLLGGTSLRQPKTGLDNGVRLLDINHDGYQDVVIGNLRDKQTRLWSPTKQQWLIGEFPFPIAGGEEKRFEMGLRFGIFGPDGHASLLGPFGAWHFDGAKWVAAERLRNGLRGFNIRSGLRFLDLDGDGRCELIATRKSVAISDPGFNGVLAWSEEVSAWRIAFRLPDDVEIPQRLGPDTGVRFADIDADGKLDLVWSNEKSYGCYLFKDIKQGWSGKLLAGKPGDAGALPLVTSNGSNMGAFFHSKHIWWQNENTSHLPNLVDRRSFAQLLGQAEPKKAEPNPGPREGQSAPKSPEEALKSIKVRPDFKVELMAAEPLVQDPVCFAFGPDGKLWVVEMGDYPLGIDGKDGAGGKVKFLEDTNADGKYDKASVFLDKLPCPTSVLPWREGVLVTAAPDIFYAEDTDGDGKADKKQVLFTGFKQGNPQHRVNSLVWGLDNWIYCANGDSGGQVKSLKTGAVVDIRGRDFRIRPDSGEIDLQLGQTQYGRCRDDWGNWFGNNNSNPLWHFALEDHYLRRNPHVIYPDGRVSVSVTPGASRIYPISKTLERFNNPQSANHFTSACAPIIYRDNHFGPDFAGNSFVCEPVHNLIHRELLTAKGTTFTSQRAKDEQESEFLASTDNWFRPVWLQTGPDGAIWIADMYRQVIEHPEWIPKQVQMKLDLRAGHDMGRIYRVYPEKVKPRETPRLDQYKTFWLVHELTSPNGWTRDMAQQLLTWRDDRQAIPLLEHLVKIGQHPETRLHALCTLDGMHALKPSILHGTLGDPHPAVRRHAIRLWEGREKSAGWLSFEFGRQAQRAGLRMEKDPGVHLQLAYTLGAYPDSGRHLAEIIFDQGGDRFIFAAVMSSVTKDNLSDMLLAVLKESQSKTPPPALIANLLRLANAFGDQKALRTVLSAVTTPDQGKYAAWQFTALAGLLDALDEQNSTLAKVSGDDDSKKQLAGPFAEARKIIGDAKREKEERLLAIRLLGRGLDNQKKDVEMLAGLLVPQSPDDVQAAVVAALGRLRDPNVPMVLLAGWKTYGPGLRNQVLDVLLRRDDWIKAILDAIEKKELAGLEIDAARRQRLLDHKDPALRKRAAAAFVGAINADRQKLIDSYQPVLTMTGDPLRGSQVFAKHCAACHKLGDVGHAVGPDLAAVGDKSPQGLLVAVLDPNRVVEARYLNYTAVTKNGQVFTGVLAAETGTSVTLLMQEGKQQVILRTDLDELLSTSKSPMPEGIEKEIGHQAMADLVAFIAARTPQVKHKEFEGNRPELVRAGANGTLWLTAKNCEIYGTTLVFERKHANLGNWYSEDDRAVWTIDVPKTGQYAVWLDWACVDASAGKPFLLEAGPVSLGGTVASTGSWDTYQQSRVGTIVLQAGQQRITFRSARKIAAALLDLKSVKLVPVQE